MRGMAKRLLPWLLVCGLLLAAFPACASPLGGMIRILSAEDEADATEEISSISVNVGWNPIEIVYNWNADEGCWEAQKDSVEAVFTFTNNDTDKDIDVKMTWNEEPFEKIVSVNILDPVITLNQGTETKTITVECEPKQTLGRNTSFYPDTLTFTINLSEAGGEVSP